MKVLVKPVVLPTEQELLYQALGCSELTSCDCFGSCKANRWLDVDEPEDILF